MKKTAIRAVLVHLLTSATVVSSGAALIAAEKPAASVAVAAVVASSEPAPAPASAPASTSAAEKLPAVHDLLVKAIREKRVLRFTYRGHTRVVEPHAYGRNTRGEAVLHAYQTEGTSATRPPPGWRTFAAAAIESASLGERTFAQARDGYSPNELHLAPLWAEVPALVAEE